MWLVGRLSTEPTCTTTGDEVVCTGGRDPFFVLQLVFSTLGCIWIFLLGGRVKKIADLPDEAWRTHLLDSEKVEDYFDEEENRRLDAADTPTITKSWWKPGKDATKGE